MKEGAAASLRDDFISMDGIIERATQAKAIDRKKDYPAKGADKYR